MEISIDLYKLCYATGFETLCKMYDAGMITREQLNDVSYYWKQANKQTYKFELNCFNDGNNCFEDIVIINVDKLEASHGHTMMPFKDLYELSTTDQDDRVQMIYNCLETVLKIRTKFGMPIQSTEVLMNITKSVIAHIKEQKA